MQQKQSPEKEVDIVDLFGLIGNFFNKIGLSILHFINFIFRNIIILTILIVIGLVWGYFANKNSTGNDFQTEMIIATNFDGANYLYKAIDEVRYRIKTRDKEFIKDAGISQNLGLIKNLKVEPIFSLDKYDEEEYNFMRIFEDVKYIDREEKTEIYKLNSTRHKITLIHKKPLESTKVLNEIVEYIRNNDFYNQLYKDYHKDVTTMLESNIYLMQQVDSLVAHYPNNTFPKNEKLHTGQGYFNSENFIDLGVTIETRRLLQQDIKDLRQEQIASTEFLRVIDEGKPLPYSEISIFEYRMTLYPLLLVLAFFILVALLKVVKKARAIEKSKQ